MRTIRGQYIGPLRTEDNGGPSGGGDPPSLPPPSAPNPAPAAPATPLSPTPAQPQGQGAGQGQPPKAPRKRSSAPKSGTSVKAGSGGVTVTHKGQSGSASATVHGPGDVIESISELPTPGGLVLLLAILLLFLFAIVPVTPTGKTRLALLWDTLRGKTRLPAPPAPTAASSSSSQTAAQQSSQNWVQDAESAALGAWQLLNPVGGNAGGAGMVPADAYAANGFHRVQDAPVPESVAAAPLDGYGYVDAWQGPTAPQPYYGENVYDAPVFPELE